MTTAQISLPKGVGPHAEKLFDAITQASTAEELNRAGGKAEGFVLGLGMDDHGQQQRGETQLEHGSHDEHLTGGSGGRMRRRIH